MAANPNELSLPRPDQPGASLRPAEPDKPPPKRPRAPFGQRYADEVNDKPPENLIFLDDKPLPPPSSTFPDAVNTPSDQTDTTATVLPPTPRSLKVNQPEPLTVDEPQKITLRDMEMFREGFETAEKYIQIREQRRQQLLAERQLLENQSHRGLLKRIMRPFTSDKQSQTSSEKFPLTRSTRRDFLQKVTGVGLTATIASAATFVTDGFGIIPHEDSQESSTMTFYPDHHTAESQLTASGDIQTIIADAEIENNGWSVEIPVEKNLGYQKLFPNDKLIYDIRTQNGGQVGKVTFENTHVSLEGNATNDRLDDDEDSIQVSVYPTDADDVLVVTLREENEAGLLLEEEAELAIHAYTYSPEDPSDHRRVFSEIDVDTLHPDKDILRRAHEMVKRFENVIPDITVTLFDASDTHYRSLDPEFYYDKVHQNIRLPVQYWTEPLFANQDTLTLFRTLCFAMVSSNKHDPARQAIAFGDLERFIETTRAEKIQRFQGESGTVAGIGNIQEAYSWAVQAAVPQEAVIACDPKRYDSHLGSEPIFTTYLLNPQYPRVIVDGITILANFASDFTLQFYVNEPSHRLNLPLFDQQIALTAYQHIFNTLETFSSQDDDWRLIIPEYDRLKEFVFTHEVSPT